MYHFEITAPVTAAAKKIIAANDGAVDRVRGSASRRIVTLPGWFQPQAARSVEREIHAAQA